jgi:hypothetical protein
MQTAPQIAEPENGPIEARPIPAAASAIEQVAKAILESRLSVETTLRKDGFSWTVKNKIVIDPPT